MPGSGPFAIYGNPDAMLNNPPPHGHGNGTSSRPSSANPSKRPSSANPHSRILKNANSNSKAAAAASALIDDHQQAVGGGGDIRRSSSPKRGYNDGYDEGGIGASGGAGANNYQNYSSLSKEELLFELQDAKKKKIILETMVSKLKADNQRWEKEVFRQQQRIDKLLDANGQGGTGTMNMETRKDVEKTLLVRQLKQQILSLRETQVAKDAEIDSLKRSTKATRLHEITREKDEYYSEVIRLQKVVRDMKNEISVDNQRREWAMNLKGTAEEELRRELSRLTTDYQNLLNQLQANKTGITPATSNFMISSSNIHNNSSNSAAMQTSNRPKSATGQSKPFSKNNSSSNNNSNNNKNASQSNNGYTTPTDHEGGNDGEPKTLIRNNVSKNSSSKNNNNNNNNSNDLVYQSKYRFGDAIECQFKGHVGWVKGAISLVRSGEMYDVRCHDGEELKMVPVDRIRGVLEIIDSEEAGQGNVTANTSHVGINNNFGSNNNSYNVNNNDSNINSNANSVVPSARSQMSGEGHEVDSLLTTSIGSARAKKPDNNDAAVISSSAKANAASEQSNQMTVTAPQPLAKAAPTGLYKGGDKIEALYYNGATWYKGTVKKCNVSNVLGPDNQPMFTYDIEYDDGEKEKGVNQKNIRLPATATSSPSKVSASIASHVSASSTAITATATSAAPSTSSPAKMISPREEKSNSKQPHGSHPSSNNSKHIDKPSSAAAASNSSQHSNNNNSSNNNNNKNASPSKSLRTDVSSNASSKPVITAASISSAAPKVDSKQLLSQAFGFSDDGNDDGVDLEEGGGGGGENLSFGAGLDGGRLVVLSSNDNFPSSLGSDGGQGGNAQVVDFDAYQQYVGDELDDDQYGDDFDN